MRPLQNLEGVANRLYVTAPLSRQLAGVFIIRDALCFVNYCCFPPPGSRGGFFVSWSRALRPLGSGTEAEDNAIGCVGIFAIRMTSIIN